MACPGCGAETRPGQKFCSECGEALSRACSACGTPYEGSPKFCAECGGRLDGGAVAGERPAGPADLAQADVAGTPAALGEPAAWDAQASIAERKQVSVLFADLVGFGASAPRAPPMICRSPPALPCGPATADDLPVAARSALWAGKVADARRAAEQMRAIGGHGRTIHAQLTTIEAGVAAAEGRLEEAATAYAEAIRHWRELNSLFELALCELDFVRFIGGERPDVLAAAEDARATFSRIGSAALLRRLDETLGLPVH